MANNDDNKWVMIEREFDASIETIWDMWTDPNLFQKWYGPKGAKIPVAEMDVTVGGHRKICMEMQRGDQTMQMWFTGEYKEINAPTKLVYTESMCDPDGNLLSPASLGMPPGQPEVTEIIVELTEKNGKTNMKMIHIGVPAASPGAGGWGMAFDKMAALLE
ncbi:MAG: SRPBCC domain-containing protein [Acidimicrobiales bacterium]|nr:SRPBCC domain-containing protein [Hyphomonadaceae bacterium]RZV37782.1 MAG: SRPBCC domain-containing protein [Acidimicrobiales bacterium]